jgi:pimeloyl-[acyl-carrier protein] synthase
VLLATEGRHDGLSTTEIIGARSLLQFAGHDTTASLLGSGTVPLLQRAEQARCFRSGEARPDVAVEELLRFEPPAKPMVRTVAESHDRHDHHFDAGAGVFMTILAANRDPRVFPQPEHLDLDRDPNPHLSFGFGHDQRSLPHVHPHRDLIRDRRAPPALQQR